MYLATKLSKHLTIRSFIAPARLFVISTLVVNGGNYFYNLILGRVLTPAAFSHAGLLVSLLLVLSFLAMTFQVVSAKYSIELEGDDQSYFQNWIGRTSLNTGLLLGIVFFASGSRIASFFQLPSAYPMYALAICLPFYFMMSTKRGFLQGKEDYIKLSASYQSEMWVRFLVTFGLIFSFKVDSDISIAVAILASILICYVFTKSPVQSRSYNRKSTFKWENTVIVFLLLTAIYEGTQILINYSDILIVKHHFDPESAGLYTSMALIGRVIYFMTWMIVMILIPKVLIQRKEGKPYQQTLFNYVALIAGFSTVLILLCLFFDQEIVTTLFGPAYSKASGFLWKYGLATMLFALANLFVYYFLCLDQKLPVYLSCIFGVGQIVLLSQFNDSLNQIIWVQIGTMGALLSCVLTYFILKEKGLFYKRSSLSNINN